MKYYRTFLALSLLSIAAAISAPAFLFADEDTELVASGKKSKFKEVMIKPGLSLKEYKNIVPVLGGIEYESAGIGYSAGQSEFEVDEQTRAALKTVFGSAMVQELMKSERFPLVGKPEADSLHVSISLENTVYYLPPPRARSENEVRRILGTRLRVVARDSKTGDIVMTIEDRTLIKSRNSVRPNEWLPQIDEVKDQFNFWAKSLRKEFEDFAAK